MPTYEKYTQYAGIRWNRIKIRENLSLNLYKAYAKRTWNVCLTYE